MGNTHETQRQLQFITNYNKENWIFLSNSNNIVLWKNKFTNQCVQAYQLFDFPTKQQLKVIQFRHKAQFIVKVKQLALSSTNCFCQINKTAFLLIQHIPIRLSQIIKLQLQEALSILYALANGMYELQQYFGQVCIFQDQIGFNSDGKAKIWINSNFLSSRPVQQMKFSASKYQNIKNIIKIVQNKINNYKFPQSFIYNIICFCNQNKNWKQQVQNYAFYLGLSVKRFLRMDILQRDLHKKNCQSNSIVSNKNTTLLHRDLSLTTFKSNTIYQNEFTIQRPASNIKAKKINDLDTRGNKSLQKITFNKPTQIKQNISSFNYKYNIQCMDKTLIKQQGLKQNLQKIQSKFQINILNEFNFIPQHQKTIIQNLQQNSIVKQDKNSKENIVSNSYIQSNQKNSNSTAKLQDCSKNSQNIIQLQNPKIKQITQQIAIDFQSFVNHQKNIFASFAPNKIQEENLTVKSITSMGSNIITIQQIDQPTLKNISQNQIKNEQSKKSIFKKSLKQDIVLEFQQYFKASQNKKKNKRNSNKSETQSESKIQQKQVNEQKHNLSVSINKYMQNQTPSDITQNQIIKQSNEHIFKQSGNLQKLKLNCQPSIQYKVTNISNSNRFSPNYQITSRMNSSQKQTVYHKYSNFQKCNSNNIINQVKTFYNPYISSNFKQQQKINQNINKNTDKHIDKKLQDRYQKFVRSTGRSKQKSQQVNQVNISFQRQQINLQKFNNLNTLRKDTTNIKKITIQHMRQVYKY